MSEHPNRPSPPRFLPPLLFLLCAGLIFAVLWGRSSQAEKLYAQAEKAFSEGDAAAAIELYTETLEADPDFLPALEGRGWAHYTQLELNAALEDWQLALDSGWQEKGWGSLPGDLIRLYAALGRLNDAYALEEALIEYSLEKGTMEPYQVYYRNDILPYELLLPGSPALRDISPLADYDLLEFIQISNAENIVSYAPLMRLPRLERLQLLNCRISDFSFLSPMTNLKSLVISDCQLTDLTALAKLTGLRTLHLDEEALTDLSPLASLRGLRTLQLCDSQALTDLSPLSSLSNLETLEFTNLTSLEDLSPLSTLTKLREIKFVNCPALVDLSPLAQLPQLEELSIYNCDNVDWSTRPDTK